MKIAFKHIYTAITFSLFLQSALFAQKLRFERYTVENGLQNNIVFAVTQDAKGLMWFATSTGIDRFDGNNFLHYPLPQKDNSYNNYVQVQHILTDYKSRIWAASSSNVFVYNSTTDAFELPKAINEALPQNKPVISLAEGSNGILLLCYNAGFSVFDTKTEQLIFSKDFNQYIRSLYQDAKGVIWASTNKGLHRFILNGSAISELNTGSTSLNFFSNMSVALVTQDKSGRYWIATMDQGLFVYDEDKEQITPVKFSWSPVGKYAIKDIYNDPDSKLTYVSLDGGGLLCFNDQLHITGTYQTNEDDPSTISNDAVYDIYSDRYHRIWATTYGGGVNVTAPDIQSFKNFRHEINNSNSLNNNAAKAITQDANGNYWFGTRKGISKLNSSTGQWQQYNEETFPGVIMADNILCLASDKKQYVWAGTYGGGVIQINTQTSQIKIYKSDPKDSTSVGTDFVYSLLFDSKQRLWAGGIRGQLSYLDEAKKNFVKIKARVNNINCIYEDSFGNILLGTEKGIYKVKADSVENVFPDIIKEKVIAIIEYKPGIYWVGTLGNGIVEITSDKKILRRFKTTDGLPADVISGFAKDKSNNDMWVGTSMGISHFFAKTNTFTTYTMADGLAGSQVNYGAVFQGEKGEMIFGTTSGFSMFNPSDIKAQGYKPVLVFTGLTVNNKLAIVGENGSPLLENLDEIKSITLKYFQNSIALDFVNTSPPVLGKHLYSWKLEGFDKSWSRPGTSSTAIYTNLRSGKYTFLIKSFAKGQSENAEVRKLIIIIQSPWWSTIWAYIAYLLLITAGIYAGYNYYNNMMARRKYAERLRLNTSFSHEIRTPLTLIKGPVTALANDATLTEENKNNLVLAKKNIEKLEQIVSQFIDFQKSGIDKLQMQVAKVDIIVLVDDVASSFRPLMKEKNIHFTYKKPSEKIEILFDREKIEKVLNNLLSNAVKYTLPGKDISLEVVKDLKYLIIHVVDTGIGIPKDQQRFMFKGYFRADNVADTKETGSGIGLNVVKELVEMHHGKLSFTSEHNEGSSFTVKLPLENEFLTQFLTHSDSKTTLPEVPFSTSGSISKEALGKKLLVVEDNDELRTYLCKELTNFGFNVSASENGKLALEILEKIKPELIITDVMMPEMNGFQLCTSVKRNIDTCHIPVIMLTAIHDKDYLLEGYRCGADDYVKKPFDMAYILTRIDNLLTNRTRFRNRIMSVFENDENTVKDDTDINWLKEITAIIVENLTNPDFSVEKLCTMVGMSRPVLFRKFKSITQESPQQYIIQVRLRKSIELLQHKTNNINEVAYECGFADPKYFSTVFKKHYGKSPTEYLKEL